MKKVLVLASVASMIGQFNMSNISLLIKMGYHVDAACNFKKGNTCSTDEIKKLKKRLREMNVGCFQIDFSRNIGELRGNFNAYKQTEKLVSNGAYQCIHCQSPIGGVIGRLIGHKHHLKVIYTAHGFHFYEGAKMRNWLLYYPVEKWLSKYTDILITINTEDYKRAKRSFHAKQIEYVPGVGVDVKKIEKVDVNRTEKRKELGMPEDAFLLLSVGELNENKNHEVVIRAMEKIEEKKLYYVICGQGDRKEYLEKLAEDYGLIGRVRLLGFRSDAIEICKASDLFIHPSKREGLSVALLEALACGIPCIASDIRGNRDLITASKEGKLVNMQNISELSETIKLLIENDMDIRNPGMFSKEKLEQFSIENVMKKMRKIYEL